MSDLNVCGIPANRGATDIIGKFLTKSNLSAMFNGRDIPREHILVDDVTDYLSRPRYIVVTSMLFLESDIGRLNHQGHTVQL